MLEFQWPYGYRSNEISRRVLTVIFLMKLISLPGILIVLGWLIVTAAILNDPLKSRSPAPHSVDSGNSIVATVGERSITQQEVVQASALSLYQVDQQRYQLLQRSLRRMVDDELLTAEASRRGVTVSQLLAEASQSESIARLADLPAPVKRLKAGDVAEGSGHSPSQDLAEEARIRQALLVSLRRRTDIRISLQAPEPPILQVSVDDDPSVGPSEAPITIVEFSDFQCPYCKKSASDLKELLRIYGHRIRLVYRDYPGPNHPYAKPAAEAAQCAGEQGKFWEYHDVLFDQQTAGKGWDFFQVAKELGLQEQSFAECMNSHRFSEEVVKDLQDGIALGVTSTPTFFVNGRPLVGAHPIADFQKLIDPLLKGSPLS